MSKRTYRSVSVNAVDVPGLVDRVRGLSVVMAIDVAKRDFKAALMERDKPVMTTLSWRAPDDTRKFVSLVGALKEVAKVEVALEPTGTYGDALRTLITGLGVPVFKVSTKHSHDAAELYDGVPSQHDAKCAAIIGWLHGQGRSSPWTDAPEEARDLAAAVDMMVLFDRQEQGCLGRLEAKLARHFPELPDLLGLGSATMLAVIEQFGDPASIASNVEAALALMRRVGGAMLGRDKPGKVVDAARSSLGVKATAGERRMLQALAFETDRQRKEALAARKVVERLGQEIEAVRRMSEVVGQATAAVIHVETGDPGSYAAPRAYIKALGLNLKIRNSGKPADQGKLKITKRGAPRARMYLYFAVLRLIQHDAHFKAWYTRKVERDGGKQKLKAVIALMRKLAAGLWHVARGAKFDSARLFDAERLGLAA